VNNKLFASVSGVCIAAAVVIGATLAASNHHAPPAPAGQPLIPAATVTVTASPTPVTVAKVSPSVKQAAPKRQAVVVVQQGDPVTPDSTSPAPQSSSDPAPQVIDNGTGTTGEDGVRRAPAPSQKVRDPAPVNPPPLGPGAPGSH
jgi:hypothetical protein